MLPMRAPSSTWARMLAASSVRGLKSVTMTTSASSAAMRPMSARLVASRSPSAPNIMMSRPSVTRRSAVSVCSNASGLWP